MKKTRLVVLQICFFIIGASSKPTPESGKATTSSSSSKDSCFAALGMEHGHIKDEDITASSAFDLKSVGPQNARLGKDIYGGAWCPKEVIAPGVREWIEIDLHREYRLTRTATQGRFGGGQGQEYAENFILEYWRPSAGKWMTYKNHSGHTVLRGNSNTYVANVNVLSPSIVASKVRFVPHSQHPRTVCMRVEVFGCRYEDDIVSYSAPPGDEFSPNFFLEDIYDGIEDDDDGSLSKGLGLLTDGLFGESVALLDTRVIPPSAPGWVGWSNRNGKPLTLMFEFRNVREFDFVTVTSYNLPQSGVQPFNQMLAFFSMDGEHFYSKYVKTVNKVDPGRVEGSINSTQKLDSRIGKFIKLEFYYENKWLLISEVRFTSKVSDKKEWAEPEVVVVVEEKDGDGDDEEEVVKPLNETTVLSDTPTAVNAGIGGVQDNDKGLKDTNNRSTASKQPSNTETSQVEEIYIGLVIGVLSVTVVLLMVIILVMVKRNKQKVFNKHSKMFKTPLGPTDRHMMRDMTPLNHSATTATSKLYEDEPEESNSIYHEPYRLVLQRGTNYRNSSCGRLCDYEDLVLLGTEQKGKFGSTPLFTIPPAPTTTSTNSSSGSSHTPRGNRFVGPTSYSCHEVKNGYAIPTHATTLGGMSVRLPHKVKNPAGENFYAATDIVIKTDSGLPSPPQRNHTHVKTPQLPAPISPAGFIDEQGLTSDSLTCFLMPSLRNVGQYEPLSDPANNLQEIPRQKLRLLEKLGEGGFGLIHLCEIDSSNSEIGKTFYDFRKMVVVKSLWKGVSKHERGSFMNVVKKLNSLRDPNVAQVIGICTQDEPLCLLSEFSEYGDLYQFLRNNSHSSSNNNNISNTSSNSSKCHYSNASDLALLHAASPNTSVTSSSSTSSANISASTLSYMATQIASGMKYLESQGFVHRDLSARNCLIGESYQIKISDCAVYQPVYACDYVRSCDNSDDELLPIRWIPWEVYVMRLWSSKSDVWSFGVTLWEIFTFCSEKPLGQLNDDQVVENLKHWFHSDGFHILPSRPSMSACSKEMFDLIRQCWSREPEHRPRFSEIQQFLQNKCIGYSVD